MEIIRLDVAIGILILIALVVYFCVEKFEPNFNYDGGLSVAIRGNVFTQPQMVGDVGLGGDSTPREEELIYTKYGKDYIQNLYDYGNVFWIPTSYTNASDTTEDGLQAYTIERSRYAKSDKQY